MSEGREWPNSGTYVDKFMVISLFKIVQDGGVIEICQVGHILTFLVFRWIYLSNLFFLEGFLLYEEKTS